MKEVIILIICIFSLANYGAQGQVRELILQSEHSTKGMRLVFSPNNSLFATMAFDDKIKLHDVKTLRVIRTLERGGRSFDTLCFSSDGGLLLAAGRSGDYGDGDLEVSIWDIYTGLENKNVESKDVNLEGFTCGNNSRLPIVQDGLRITPGENSIVVTREREKKTTVIDSPDEFDISPDGQLLATFGVERYSFTIWSASTGEKLYESKESAMNIQTSFLSDDNVIGISRSNGDIILWNYFEGRTQVKLNKGESEFISLIWFSKDGKSVIAKGPSPEVVIWHRQSKTRRLSIPTSFYEDEKPSVSDDGSILVVVNEDRKVVHMWNLNTMNEIKTIKTDREISATGLSTSNRLLAVATHVPRHSVIIFDVAKSAPVSSFGLEIDKNSRVLGLKFSSDNNLLALSEVSSFSVWDIRNRRLVFRTIRGTAIEEVVFSPDSRFVAVLGHPYGAAAGQLQILNTSDGRRVKLAHPLPEWVSFGRLKRFHQRAILAIPNIDRTNLYDVVSEKELGSLTLLNETDWLVTTPEGFFDGTPNAWKQLLWRFNNNTFDYSTVETYFNDFFYPNLLQDVLAGRSPQPKAGNELEKIDRRQPTVEIAGINGLTKDQVGNKPSEKRIATVTVEATENLDKPKQSNHRTSAEVRDLRLLRNGSLVKIWHGDSIDEIVKNNKTDCVAKAVAGGAGRKLVCKTDISIIAGANDLTAYAFNAANVKSNDDSATVPGANSLKRDGTLYVLAVGINKYRDARYNLNFAVPDVVDIGKAVTEQQAKFGKDNQYARTEVITLTDEDATKANILLGMRRFFDGDKAVIPSGASDKLRAELAKIKPTQPEDALVIYYAGHGASRDERFYLMPHNFTGNDPNSLMTEGISDIELNDVLEKVDAGRILMVIDACQSGAALGGRNDGRAPMNSKGLAQLAYDKGMLILTAAQSQQAALEAVKIGPNEIRHGLLTYALLEAIRNPKAGADKDTDGRVTEREWFDYAVEQVPRLQTEAMIQRRIDMGSGKPGMKGRSDIFYVDGDDPQSDPEKRKVQTPRVLYRRETETNPMIIGKP